MVHLRHLHSNVKPKFTNAMNCCFNARHRSSNSVSARKTLTTAPLKYVQRLIIAGAHLVKQCWSSVKDFCVGLADPSVHELVSRCAKLWLCVVGAVVNFAGAENYPSSPHAILCAAQYFRSGGGHRRCPSVYVVSLTEANVCWTVTSGGEFFTALGTLHQSLYVGTEALHLS